MSDGFKFQASVKDADGDMVNVRADSPEELDAYLSNFPVAAYAQFKANVRGGQALGAVVQPVQVQVTPDPNRLAPQPPAPQPQSWGNPPVQEVVPSWAAQSAQPLAAPPQQFGPANGSPHPDGVRCPCGQPVLYKSFTSKAGKPIKLWSCPNQRAKDDGHHSEFVKD